MLFSKILLFRFHLYDIENNLQFLANLFLKTHSVLNSLIQFLWDKYIQIEEVFGFLFVPFHFYIVLNVYHFLSDDFLRSLTNVVHFLHPFHLIVGFQFLCYALCFHHFFYQIVLVLLCCFVHFQKVIPKFVHQQHGVVFAPVCLFEVFSSHQAVFAQFPVVLLALHLQIWYHVISHFDVIQFCHFQNSLLLFQFHALKC